MDKFIGLKLDGRYQITELIGVGGMSDVYKGIDIMENRTVAVKILKREFAENEEFVRYFRNESRAIAVLSHPNIVKIFDVGYEHDLQYIVMEYINGITLKECIEQKGMLQWRECVHYTIQILRALQLAHDRGIIHRDIKPQNVMLLADGTIKVMDFGIACFSRQNAAGTNTERTMGSVHYVSPEQARGERTDERGDLYSVGVMMYEMLTGRKPFDGETAVAVALKHMNEEPVRPSEYNSNIYKGLEEIVLRAMEKEPTKRYQSASEMIRDIEAFKSDQSITFGYFDEPVKKPEQQSVLDGLKTSVSKKRAARPKVKKEKPKPEPVPEEPEEYPEEDYDDDDDDEDERPRHNYILPILAAMTVTVIIVATLFMANVIMGAFQTTASSSNDYTMPNLIGLNYYEARSLYSEIQLVASEEYSSEYEAGIIMEQEKAEGRIVKVGDAIKVTVSKGTRTVTIPDVVNYHYSSAYAALTGESLTVQRVEIESDDISSGYVVKTDPVAYSTVEEGTTVKVYVSIGPSVEDTTVPTLVGLTVSEAQSLLEDNYLVAKTQYVESSEEAGTVIDQSVEAGETVTRNTTVTIYVSDGTVTEEDVDLSDDEVIDDGSTTTYPGIIIDNGTTETDTTETASGNTVILTIDIPARATNTYYLTVYNSENGEALTSTITLNGAEYAGGSLAIALTGEGTMNVYIMAKSPRTGLQMTFAEYTIDFDTGTYYRSNYWSSAFTIIDS
ncbi:MAG: Stk1 family PASTA domain-containing Ser/Thr kinase [Oscillospiraceae bacterium]|nr:Stk1 family PASTA domain-containing Ser/Thr kinase [Oscillospiraceae bacterium]